MKFKLTYDIGSGLVIGMDEENTAEITMDLSGEEFLAFQTAQKQFFVKGGILEVLDEPVSVEERVAHYERPLEPSQE